MINRLSLLSRSAGLAIVLGSMFALVWVANASAAEIEWRQGGTALTTAVEDKSSGVFKLSDPERNQGALELECSESGTGTAGPGAADKESKFEFPLCKPTAECEGGLTVEVQHLPWKSELVWTGAKQYDVISSGGTGTPGVKFTCTHLGTPNWPVDECSGNLRTTVTDTTSGVEGSYANEELLKCTWKGFKSSGSVTGTRLVRSLAGPALEATRPENWLQGGSALTGSVATKISGSIKLTNAGTTVECKDAGEGSAGTGGSDELTKLSFSSCVFVSDGSCEAEVAPQIKAANLSWHSELVLSEGLTPRTHDVTYSGGKGVPTFTLECRVGFIHKNLTCTASSLKMSAKNVSGAVEGAFDGEKLTCEKLSGVLEGTQSIEATSGSALEVAFP